MKTTLLLFLALALTSPAWSLSKDCRQTENSVEEILNLAEEANEITGAMTQTQKVLDLTVTKYYTNQGKGKVSVLTDDNGNLSGIRVDFAVKGKPTDTMIRTLDEMKNGSKLEYKENNSPAALIVQKASGSEISAKSGGKFLFSVLTKKPKEYKNYVVQLQKNGDQWIIKNEKGATLSSIDLNPNVSGMEWDGTFAGAKFQ